MSFQVSNKRSGVTLWSILIFFPNVPLHFTAVTFHRPISSSSPSSSSLRIIGSVSLNFPREKICKERKKGERREETLGRLRISNEEKEIGDYRARKLEFPRATPLLPPPSLFSINVLIHYSKLIVVSVAILASS